jgi:hypothetical protein
MRRGGAGGLTARLMCAGRDRSSAIRRKVPWTKSARGVGHSLNGGQFCGGGAPAHGGVLALAQLKARASRSVWHNLRIGVRSVSNAGIPRRQERSGVRHSRRGGRADGRRGESRRGRKNPEGSP